MTGEDREWRRMRVSVRNQQVVRMLQEADREGESVSESITS